MGTDLIFGDVVDGNNTGEDFGIGAFVVRTVFSTGPVIVHSTSSMSSTSSVLPVSSFPSIFLVDSFSSVEAFSD